MEVRWKGVRLLLSAMFFSAPPGCIAQDEAPPADAGETRLGNYDTAQHSGEAVAGQAPSESRRTGKVRMLFIGSSYLAAAGGQSYLVPALLAPKGWRIDVGVRMGPGMSVVKQYYYDRGELAPWHLATLERIAARSGADSEEYKTRRARMEQEVAKAKGLLTKVLDAGDWEHVILCGAGTDKTFHDCTDAVVAQIREKSPKAKIYLYNTWVPQGYPDTQEAVTREGIRACLRNGLTHIPCGEAMHAAHKARGDLQIFRTKTDSHPGLHGGYLLACAICAAITGQSPVGLPEAVTIPTSYDFMKESESGKKQAEFRVTPDSATFLQETVWRVHQENLKRIEAVRKNVPVKQGGL
jgi:hypothetical protein